MACWLARRDRRGDELVDLGAHVRADHQVEGRARMQPRQLGDGEIGPHQRRAEQAVIDGARFVADRDVVAGGPELLGQAGIEALIGGLVVEPAQRIVLQLRQRAFARAGGRNDRSHLDPQGTLGRAGGGPLRLGVQHPALGREHEGHVRRARKIERVGDDLRGLVALGRRIGQRDGAGAGEAHGIRIELDRAVGEAQRHRHDDLARLDGDLGDVAQGLAGRGGECGEQPRRQLDDVAGDPIGVAVAVGAAPHHDLAILVPEIRRIDQLGVRQDRRDTTVRQALRDRGHRPQCDRKRHAGAPQDPLDLGRGDALTVIHRDPRA